MAVASSETTAGVFTFWMMETLTQKVTSAKRLPKSAPRVTPKSIEDKYKSIGRSRKVSINSATPSSNATFLKELKQPPALSCLSAYTEHP